MEDEFRKAGKYMDNNVEKLKKQSLDMSTVLNPEPSPGIFEATSLLYFHCSVVPSLHGDTSLNQTPICQFLATVTEPSLLGSRIATIQGYIYLPVWTVKASVKASDHSINFITDSKSNKKSTVNGDDKTEDPNHTTQ